MNLRGSFVNLSFFIKKEKNMCILHKIVIYKLYAFTKMTKKDNKEI